MPIELTEPLDLYPVDKSCSPKVTVVIPAYKASATLREAVASVLQQDFRDLEVIVVDDACPERSSKVVQKIQDPRLRILILQHNQGLSGARNAGIRVARGEYIAFLDADDTSEYNRISMQAGLLDSQPKVGLVGGLHNRMDFSGRRIHAAADIWRLPDSALRPLLLFQTPFTSAVMIRRSALPNHGYRKMLCEDYAMVSDVAQEHDIAMIRSAIINYRSSPNGIMASQRELVDFGAELIKRELLARLGIDDGAYASTLLNPIKYLAVEQDSRNRVNYLDEYRRFLNLILSKNEMSKVYSQSDLKLAISSYWGNLLLENSRARSGLRFSPHLLSMLASFRPTLNVLGRLKALVHSCVNLWRSKAMNP